MDKPDAKPPNIDSFLFSTVSFELILLSVEQSLRLLLLLHFGIIRDDTNHNPHVLYGTARNRSGGKEGLREDIVHKMNELGRTENIKPIEERELVACLQKHDSSYSNFRYFHLDRQAKLNMSWELSARDVQIVHCLALTLIHLNMDEMGKQGIPAMLSMSAVPESEITENLRALKNVYRPGNDRNKAKSPPGRNTIEPPSRPIARDADPSRQEPLQIPQR